MGMDAVPPDHLARQPIASALRQAGSGAMADAVCRRSCGPDVVWVMEFRSDRPFDGRPLRIPTVVDCRTREALSLDPRADFRPIPVTTLWTRWRTCVRRAGRPRRSYPGRGA